MRGRDPVIVTAKEREKVLREIALVRVRQRSHDAEVERDVFALVRRVGRDEDVSRMHVGVEEAVAKNLGEENLDTGARELLNVDALHDEPVDLGNRRSLHLLHDHYFAAAPVPEDLGHEKQRRVEEIAAELRAVRSFPREIELYADGA